MKYLPENRVEVHKRIHSAEKPFICDFNGCNKKYIIKSHLNAHKNAVHLKINYIGCYFNNCNKMFANKTALKGHKCVHSSEKAFVCDLKDCQKKYRYNSVLYKHKKTIHPINNR